MQWTPTLNLVTGLKLVNDVNDVIFSSLMASSQNIMDLECVECFRLQYRLHSYSQNYKLKSITPFDACQFTPLLQYLFILQIMLCILRRLPIAVVCLVLSTGVASFTCIPGNTAAYEKSIPEDVGATEGILSRRIMLQKTMVASGLFTTVTLMAPTPSLALKQRNEQLCATGFFTNYLEYRCTEIGDISDEGQKTTFSSKDAGAADSLMDKLNLMDTPTTTSEDTSKDDDKQTQQRENVNPISSK